MEGSAERRSKAGGNQRRTINQMGSGSKRFHFVFVLGAAGCLFSGQRGIDLGNSRPRVPPFKTQAGYGKFKKLAPLRRDGRVVEGARLESVFRGNSNVGSNPTLSAINKSTTYINTRIFAGNRGQSVL
jgi:hypothetical protein